MPKRNPKRRDSRFDSLLEGKVLSEPRVPTGPRFVPVRPGKPVLPGILLFLLVFGAFLPSLRNGFVNYDDDSYVYANGHVRNGLSRENLVWAFSQLHGEF